MSHVPKRGEVWQVDFGITQKVRPALVISIITAPFLTAGAFLVQGIQAVPPKYFLRRLGVLTPEQLRQVERALLRWEGFGENE